MPGVEIDPRDRPVRIGCVAAMFTEAGARNDAPADGLVIETFGSWFDVVATVTLTAVDGVVTPLLS